MCRGKAEPAVAIDRAKHDDVFQGRSPLSDSVMMIRNTAVPNDSGELPSRAIGASPQDAGYVPHGPARSVHSVKPPRNHRLLPLGSATSQHPDYCMDYYTASANRRIVSIRPTNRLPAVRPCAPVTITR